MVCTLYIYIHTHAKIYINTYIYADMYVCMYVLYVCIHLQWAMPLCLDLGTSVIIWNYIIVTTGMQFICKTYYRQNYSDEDLRFPVNTKIQRKVFVVVLSLYHSVHNKHTNGKFQIIIKYYLLHLLILYNYGLFSG